VLLRCFARNSKTLSNSKTQSWGGAFLCLPQKKERVKFSEQLWEFNKKKTSLVVLKNNRVVTFSFTWSRNPMICDERDKDTMWSSAQRCHRATTTTAGVHIGSVIVNQTTIHQKSESSDTPASLILTLQPRKSCVLGQNFTIYCSCKISFGVQDNNRQVSWNNQTERFALM
jgi:hypothetical protein